MKQLYKYWFRPATDRHLLALAALLLGVMRLGLWLLPFQILLRLQAAISHKTVVQSAPDRIMIERVAWAVEVGGRYVPRTTCLTQALALQILLGRLGHPSSLCLGVTRNVAGQVEAHAWVECEERIVMGGWEDLSRYTLLPPLKGI